MSWLYQFRLSEPIEPFPMLHTIIDEYYGCVYCAYAVKAANRIKDHYKQQHPDQEITLRRCGVQGLQIGRRFRYVQVKATTSVARPTFSGLLATYADDEAQYVSNVVSTVRHNREPNHWLERMGFSAHLEGYDLGFVANLVNPTNHSFQLIAVSKHLKALCFRAANRLAADAVSNDTLLKQLNRRTSSDAALQPFNWRIQNETMSKYVKTWSYILGYVERLYHWSYLSEPPCRLTDSQHVAFSNAVSLDWGVATEEDKDAVVLDLVWCISNHQLRRSSFESVLVSACAALAVDPRNNSWRSSFAYDSSHFPAIIKILLFMIYMRAVMAVDDQIHDKPKPSWTRIETPIPRFRDDLDAITQAMDGVVYVRNADSHSTPVTWTTSAQIISKETRMGNARPPMVEWEPDGHLRLISEGTTTSRRSLSKLMLTATFDAEESICGLFLQSPDSDAVDPVLDALVPDLTQIQDDRSNLALDYSFLCHPANRAWVSDASVYLTSKVDANADLRMYWFVGNTINLSAVKTYEARRKKFLSTLAVAIHLTAGQPSRRTEMQILRWRNSLQGGMRNIIVCNGRVGVRSIWYKRRWTAKVEVPVWRFLPPLLSRVVVLYITVVIPFSKCLQRYLGSKGNVSCFLYANNLINPDAEEDKLIDEGALLSRPFGLLYSRVAGGKMTVAQYRHVAIAYARRFMHNQSIDVILGLDAADDDEGTQQPSTKRQDLMGVTHAQAAHSAQIADLVYAVEYDSGEKFNRFLEASLYWHALFDLTSSRRSGDEHPGGVFASRVGVDERVARLSLLPDLSTEKSLRDVISHGNDVRAQQRRTRLFEAVDNHHKVVYVVGNESRASVAFDPLSYLHIGGCTVLIQPTKISQERTYARLSALGLRPLLWDSRSAITPAAVVLVTPEDMRKREWRGFLHRQRAHLYVDLVVLDEAHEVLLARRELRSKFLDLAVEMDVVCSRQVFVAGILPPALQGEFCSLLNLSGNEVPPCVLRSQTTKDNIRYEYIDADPTVSVPQVVCDMTSRASRERRRAIVVSLSYDVCDMVSAALDVPKYCDYMSSLEQQRSLARWETERGVFSMYARSDHLVPRRRAKALWPSSESLPRMFEQ
ncbi:hypothetical protein F5Y13DRAFT_200932 [Hypoxylon sp. FL1857]|nr:hypothetical protein F5Y13DRAFT_200932 [Hypoxylon sp. FL1857]